MMKPDYDLIIAGGGLAGLALALLLAPQKFRVLLVDALAAPGDSVAHFDDRSLALTPWSATLLTRAGLWSAIESESAAIRDIHISDRGQWGRCVLRAADQGRAALGHVAELRVLSRVLGEAVHARNAATLCAPARIAENAPHAGYQRVQVIRDNGSTETITTRWLIGADGGQSSLRARAGIPVQIDDYHQSAIVANLQCDRGEQGIAYERFTDTGPLALLPLPRNRHALVWTLSPEHAVQKMAASDADFLRDLQRAFGWRAGALAQVGSRSCFPLARHTAAWRRQGRLLLMGNAAQQLHPVAGQGFNLALRDVAAFADLLNAGGVPELADVERWLAARRVDQQHVANTTHNLVQIFSNDFPVLRPLRAAGLSLMDVVPPLKRALGSAAMGFR